MYCNNHFYGKYWAKVRTKLPPPPGDPITGVHITEGQLYWRKFAKGTDQEKLIHCDTTNDTVNFRSNESRMITKSCTVYKCLRVCGYTMMHYQLTEKYENYNERYTERNTEEKDTIGYDDTVLSSTNVSKGSYVRTAGLCIGFEPNIHRLSVSGRRISITSVTVVSCFNSSTVGWTTMRFGRNALLLEATQIWQ